MKALHFLLYLDSYERVKSNFPKKSKLKWNIVSKIFIGIGQYL